MARKTLPVGDFVRAANARMIVLQKRGMPDAQEALWAFTSDLLAHFDAYAGFEYAEVDDRDNIIRCGPEKFSARRTEYNTYDANDPAYQAWAEHVSDKSHLRLFRV